MTSIRNLLLSVAILAQTLTLRAAEAPPMPSTVAPGAEPVELYGAETFFEGPTWDPRTGKLYFTTPTEKETIFRLDGPGEVSNWMEKTRGINGTFLSLDGRLLAAQGHAKSIVSIRIGADGPEDFKVLATDPSWQVPNDLCQLSSGDIYFTDPLSKDRPKSGVYHVAPSGKWTKVVSDMPQPNGIIASNDGKTLYVSDTHDMLWRSFPINEDGTLDPGKVFFNPDRDALTFPEDMILAADGMSIDEHGNLYLTGLGGVWVVDPAGKPLGRVTTIPHFISNVAFGGEDGKTLFMVGMHKVYSLQMRVRGGGPHKSAPNVQAP